MYREKALVDPALESHDDKARRLQRATSAMNATAMKSLEGYGGRYSSDEELLEQLEIDEQRLLEALALVKNSIHNSILNKAKAKQAAAEIPTDFNDKAEVVVATAELPEELQDREIAPVYETV